MDKPSKLTTFSIGERTYETQVTVKYEKRKSYQPVDPKKVICVIPGVIQKIHVRKGQRVSRGDSLLILEAMKMQNDITSPLDGVIKEVFVGVGHMAAKGEVMMEFV